VATQIKEKHEETMENVGHKLVQQMQQNFILVHSYKNNSQKVCLPLLFAKVFSKKLFCNFPNYFNGFEISI